MHTDLYWGGFDHTPARLELARAALEEAERIQPDAGEVHMVKGLFAYHGHRDYDGARAEFALARQTLPNSSLLAANIAAVDRRQGRWDDSFSNYQRAIELDPLDSVTLEETGFTYSRMRRFAEAKPYLERAAAANPNDIFVRLVLWSLPYFERGETSSLRSQLDELLRTNPGDAPRLATFYVEVALAERNRAAAEQALRLIPAEAPSTLPLMFSGLATGMSVRSQRALAILAGQKEPSLPPVLMRSERRKNSRITRRAGLFSGCSMPGSAKVGRDRRRQARARITPDLERRA